MSKSDGQFVWYDNMTTDIDAATTFYKKVIGWEAMDSGMPDRAYTILSTGNSRIGGLMPLPDDMRAAGAPPHWRGYISVEDVDASAEKVKAAGGIIHHAPEDIPGVGRFAFAADPHGAMFILFKPAVAPSGDPLSPNTHGHVGWHELHAGDLDSAWAFYEKIFGWTKGEPIDMGPMGIYQIFDIQGTQSGGMMTKMPQTPVPFWLYYFTVDAIDAASTRVKESGGQIINGPIQVPGGSWIVNCVDPQGAVFAMVAGNR